MIVYPYNSPIILNDSLYEEYGGHLDTLTPAQRQLAFRIAEMEMSAALETYLLPTIVTGTYSFSPSKGSIILDHTWINSINVVRFLDTQERVYWTQSGTANVHISLADDERGLMDIHSLIGSCACHTHSRPYPYRVQVMYTAGFPTGTANQPDIVLALVSFANIIVNEIIGYGNEGSADIGVQEFRTMGYWESRVGLLRTSFGSSAMAQFVDKLIRKYKRRRYVGL